MSNVGLDFLTIVMNMIHEKSRGEAERIADVARNSISRICMEDCHAYCCRKGFLVLKKDEVDTVTQNKRAELLEKRELKQLLNGDFSLKLSGNGCPSLKENKCTIHKNLHRPRTCHEFPLFIIGDTVRLSPRCLAVKMGVFYPFEKEWLRLGFKLDHGGSLADSDFFNLPVEK